MPNLTMPPTNKMLNDFHNPNDLIKSSVSSFAEEMSSGGISEENFEAEIGVPFIMTLEKDS